MTWRLAIHSYSDGYKKRIFRSYKNFDKIHLMKLLLLILALLFPILIFSQTKYFDTNDKEISKSQFLNLPIKNGELKVYNDSLKIGKIISQRNERGVLDSNKFYELINQNLKIKLKENNPTVVIFYTGKDSCNSSGRATPNSNHQWFNELMDKSNEVTSTNYIFIYKSKKGLKYTKEDIWYKDPKGLIELSFFKYHYPCSSYVIIYDSKYISHFGEFDKENVLENLKNIIK
jgi:hypothetical protein